MDSRPTCDCQISMVTAKPFSHYSQVDIHTPVTGVVCMSPAPQCCNVVKVCRSHVPFHPSGGGCRGGGGWGWGVLVAYVTGVSVRSGVRTCVMPRCDAFSLIHTTVPLPLPPRGGGWP